MICRSRRLKPGFGSFAIEYASAPIELRYNQSANNLTYRPAVARSCAKLLALRAWKNMDLYSTMLFARSGKGTNQHRRGHRLSRRAESARNGRRLNGRAESMVRDPIK